MKRTLLFTAFLAAVAVLASCKKDDSLKPSITWPSNEKFTQMELGPKADGALSLAAPEGFQSITLTLNLGEYNVLANNHIATSANKGGANRSAIFDIIDDKDVVSLLQGLGQSAGTSLRGKTVTNLDIIKILEALIEKQDVKNNTSFIIDVNVVDKNSASAFKSAKFHFTAPPTITPDASFDENGILKLESATSAKVRIQAPGKIKKLRISMDSGSDFLSTYIKQRTTGEILVIDLINDSKVGDSFKGSFPAGNAVEDKTDITLDFSFLQPLRFSFPGTTNVFTVHCEDANGKTCSEQFKFVG